MKGYKVRGQNFNSIFQPAASFCKDGTLSNEGEIGYYWSGSLMQYSATAHYRRFDSDDREYYIYYIYSQVANMLTGAEGYPKGAIVKAACGMMKGEIKWLVCGELVENAFFWKYFPKPDDYKCFHQMIKGSVEVWATREPSKAEYRGGVGNADDRL